MSGFDERLAAWFSGRRWRVMSERDGTVTVLGVKVTFDRGAFEIDQPGCYVTPLGSRGRHGYVIIETDDDGHDVPGTGIAFGEAALRRAQRAYGTVSGLPGEG